MLGPEPCWFTHFIDLLHTRLSHLGASQQRVICSDGGTELRQSNKEKQKTVTLMLITQDASVAGVEDRVGKAVTGSFFCFII